MVEGRASALSSWGGGRASNSESWRSCTLVALAGRQVRWNAVKRARRFAVNHGGHHRPHWPTEHATDFQSKSLNNEKDIEENLLTTKHIESEIEESKQPTPATRL